MEKSAAPWSKSPPDLVERFTRTMAGFPTAEVRQMFGYPAAFANGYMFTSLFEDRWIVRLPTDGLDELAALGGQEFSPMPGRPMRGYLALPEAMTTDADTLAPWLDRALAHVQGMPPKKKGR
jgi:TfoX/Sxy family transcriptional regulator of competence genes